VRRAVVALIFAVLLIAALLGYAVLRESAAGPALDAARSQPADRAPFTGRKLAGLTDDFAECRALLAPRGCATRCCPR
jgi:hypothetical protein